MNDATKILDWLNANPGYSWLPVLAVLVIFLLGYEVLKSLLPHIVKTLASTIASIPHTRQTRLKAERSIRRMCIASRNVSWVSSLPALSRFDFSIPLSDVFVAPGLQISRNGSIAWATTLQEFLSTNRVACITGAPGSGKSTLLSMTAVAFAQEDADVILGINEARLPLCFDCKEFPLTTLLPPAPELFAALFKKRGVHIEADYLQQLLDQGRCAVLLDGLDEVGGPIQRKMLLDWLIGLSVAYSEKNRYLITCRDFEWQDAGLPFIARAKVLPFSITEAQAFIDRWRKRSSTDLPNDQKAEARESRFEILIEELDREFEFLYTNPMLLTLALVLLTVDIPLPRKRSHILDTFVLAMLGEWQSLKERGPRPNGMESTFTALRRLALYSLESGKTQINANDPRLLPMLRQNESDEVDAGTWLVNISMSSGLLQPLGDKEWSFTNRRIVEFLAAGELVSQPIKWRSYWEDPIWKEVMIFLPEMVINKVHHLAWVKAQGDPTNDMHALFLLSSAIECQDVSPDHANKSIKMVRNYFLKRVFSKTLLDEDLARRYMRADHDNFMSDFESHLSQVEQNQSGVELFFAALRAGYAPAVRALSVRFEGLNFSTRSEIVEALPTYRPIVQVTMLPALLQANPGARLRRALSLCGSQTLSSLITIARQPPNARIREEAFAAIAEFSLPNAIAFLTETLGVGNLYQVARSALERNLVVIGADIKETDLELILGNSESVYQKKIKPALDRIFALAMLIFFSPILIMICILLKITSRKSVLVKTLMMGRNGRTFNRPRFRTISDDENLEVVVQSSRHDARITWLGGFLRRTSLDEIPAILSIVRGDMGFIGPRALPPHILQARFRHGYGLAVYVRKRLRPGFIGLADIEFADSGSISSERETALDMYYAANCGFLFDMRIFVKANRLIFFGPNRY